MSHLIRTTGTMIPGGYQFHDRITGRTYNDLHTLFDARVREIINDRNANHRLFTDENLVDFNAVSRELSEQNCSRLKHNGLFCTDGVLRVSSSAPKVAAQSVSGKVCPRCASQDIVEILCKTCGGRKVTGYRCRHCGQETSK